MTGKTFVFLHGLGSSHQQFDFIRSVVPEGVNLLMVDFPGHGVNVTKMDPAPSFDGFTKLLCAVCDHLGIQRATFVGLSMGAALSLRCATQRSDLVSQMILIRPSWLASTCPPHLSLIDRCGTWLTGNDSAKAVRFLESDAEYCEMQQDVPRAAASVRGLFNRPYATEHASTLRAMYHDRPFATLSDLRNISAPATVIGTHADQLHPIAIANATANALPAANLQVLPPRYLRPDDHARALIDIILNNTGVAA